MKNPSSSGNHFATLGALLDRAPGESTPSRTSVLQYKPHGACGIVTGSSHFLRHVPTDSVIMVDCGMVQGELDDEAIAKPYPVHPSTVDLLLITHAHIDHIGNLLDFMEAGFTGPILCTRVTAQLTLLSLEDALGLRFRGQDDAKLTAEELKLTRQLKALPERFIAIDEHVAIGDAAGH